MLCSSQWWCTCVAGSYSGHGVRWSVLHYCSTVRVTVGGGGGEAARQLLVSPLVNFELSADPRYESRFIARMHE